VATDVGIERFVADLVCFSRARFAGDDERPRQVMTRWATTHRVFFVEEPIRDHGPTRLELRDEDGVLVAVPHVREDAAPDRASTELAMLLTRMYDEFEIDHPIAWYDAPTYLPTTRHLEARVVVYDRGAAPFAAPRDLERELLQASHVVLGAEGDGPAAAWSWDELVLSMRAQVAAATPPPPADEDTGVFA
jgi:UDP-galactopyranose mutase